MKKIEEMTIPELVEAWRWHDVRISRICNRGDEPVEEMTDQFKALSRALDAKCQEAGMGIISGNLTFGYFSGGDMVVGDYRGAIWFDHISPADIHALLGYLLEKQR
jgi:hypothetical protein